MGRCRCGDGGVSCRQRLSTSAIVSARFAQALLDPDATRPDLEMWVGKPISQYYAIEMDNLAASRGKGAAGLALPPTLRLSHPHPSR